MKADGRTRGRTGGQADGRTADGRTAGQADGRTAWSVPRGLLPGIALLLVACATQPAPGTLSAGPPVRPSAHPSARLPALISTDQLAAWQRRGEAFRLVDVRTDPFTYLKGHLPDAVYLNTETLRAAERGTPMQLFSGQWYAELFARLGIRWDQPVVVYSAGETHNIDATFLVWLLASYGHPRVYLLDGGYFKWELEQRPIGKPYPKIAGAPLPSGRFAPPIATLEDVRRAVARIGRWEAARQRSWGRASRSGAARAPT